MTLVSKCFALTALSVLAVSLRAAAGGPTAVRAPLPVIEARVPPGGVRLEMGRIPSLKRPLFAVRDVASDSSLKAATLEVALGTTPALERYNELRQSVALLADGTYASVWTEGDNERGEILMQWVRPDGSKVFPGGGRRVGDGPEDEYDAVVAPNPAGGAFVAFSRSVASDQAQVYVQSFDAAGRPRWAPGGVFAALVERISFQDWTQLLAAPNGGVYVCLYEFHSPGNNRSDIRCQRLDAQGNRLWTDAGVRAAGRKGWKVVPKLVPDGRGGALVFWRNNRDFFTAPDEPILVEGQHLAPDGTRTWGALGRILRTANLAAANSSGPQDLSAASDGQGGAIVSFNDWSGRGAPALDVYAQRVAGDGRLLWRNGAAVARGDAQQQNDSITATPDGGAFVTVWDPQALWLWLYRLSPQGKVRWKQRLSATDVGSRPNDWGAYGSFDKDRLRVAWIHERQQATWTSDIYLAIFDLAGHRLNGPTATPVSTALDGQFLSGFVFDPARRQGFAVWNDHREGSDFDTVGGLYKE